jgi:adenosine deaminase
MMEFVRGLPKAELHLHIEGTLEPELMFELAGRNRVTLPYPTVEAARAAYDFEDLQSFLDLYYAGAAVLRTQQDFADLMIAYLDRAVADGVRHAEIFFDPQTHTERGVDIGVVINGLAEGQAARADAISTGLILCFLRHLPPEDALATLSSAEPHLDHIVGVGLDSSERGFPPDLFAEAYTRADALGLHKVAHAGEEGPAAYVRSALDVLGVERIDHGVHAVDDPDLVRRLAEDQIPLTMCPLSNRRLQVTPDLKDHPLRRLLEAGVMVSVNSDDPAYFGGYIAENYVAIADALELPCEDLVAIARNSIQSTFLPSDEIASLIAELDRYTTVS